MKILWSFHSTGETRQLTIGIYVNYNNILEVKSTKVKEKPGKREPDLEGVLVANLN